MNDTYSDNTQINLAYNSSDTSEKRNLISVRSNLNQRDFLFLNL